MGLLTLLALAALLDPPVQEDRNDDPAQTRAIARIAKSGGSIRVADPAPAGRWSR